MSDLNQITKGFKKVNSRNESLTVLQVNYDFKNGGTEKIFDFLVEIDGREYWFNDAQLDNFLEN